MKKTNGFGTAALTLGIIGLVFSCVPIPIGVVPAAIGLILGMVGLAQRDRTKGTSIAGVVCSSVGISIFILIVFSFYVKEARAIRENEQRSEKAEMRGENKTEISTGGLLEPEAELFDKEMDVEILAEYTLQDGIGWNTYHFMVVRNNSTETVDIFTSSLAYSVDGNILGAGDASLDAIGNGCASIMYEAFETEGEISKYETEISAKPSKYYESVIQDLKYVQNSIDNGAVFQVTNNGDEPAEFVEGYALFFLGNELVAFEIEYFVDDDSEIKSGETVSKQMTCYDEFDRIEFYLTGKR